MKGRRVYRDRERKRGTIALGSPVVRRQESGPRRCKKRKKHTHIHTHTRTDTHAHVRAHSGDGKQWRKCVVTGCCLPATITIIRSASPPCQRSDIRTGVE